MLAAAEPEHVVVHSSSLPPACLPTTYARTWWDPLRSRPPLRIIQTFATFYYSRTGDDAPVRLANVSPDAG